jgi:ABC-type multidrug transport system fused ATPase/permease subunit
MVTRMTSDINQVQNGVNLTLRLLLRSPFVVFGAMIMAFTIDFQAALVFAGIIPVLCVVVFGIMLITMPMYKRVQTRLDGVTAATRQNLAGVRVLRSFCMEDAQIAGFEEKTAALNHEQIISGRISALLNPLTFVIINLAVVILIRIGALKVEMGILTQGMVVALYNYMSQILVELIKMANLIITMTKAAACGNRIQQLLEIPVDNPTGKSTDEMKGTVTFQNVTAHYDGAGAPSLENICFTAQAGQIIGIIGGTGAGKTTLAELIAGFYPAAGGQILLDGRPIGEYDPQTLRRHIGVVPQKALLFKGTIRENLLWGNENATEDALWAALDTAQARDVVEHKPGGLDAPISQGGTNLSGGQRQRLTIARALVKQPAILILDDSASALDYATDARLRSAIGSLTPSPTTFIISQRAASVRFADQILVLDDGELAGQGTHDELLASCPAYQEIYYSQFPKEVR